jgi:methylmalonyl-CoA/ethylmalonyl-CoA epimerase
MEKTNNPVLNINQAKQVAFVVVDLREAMERMWTVFGIGPWSVDIRDPNATEDHALITDMVYMKKPGRFSYQAAVANLGSLIIELIQPLEGDNIYSDFLRQYGEGMQHLGYQVVNSEKEFAKVTKVLEENGFPCLQRATLYASKVAYFDTTSALNTILEVIYRNPERKRPEAWYVYPTPE